VVEPRYALAIVIEHGMHGASCAPIARDMITYMYDRKRADERLAFLEEKWGGNIEQRMAAEAYAWAHRNDPAPVKPPKAVPPSAQPVAEAAVIGEATD
jgi:penicillin-binding protein 2